MGELLQHLLDWVNAHPNWAYSTVLLASFAESVAIVGVLLPGVMIMLAAGALVGTGHLDFGPVCVAAVIGAIGGDGLSFWLGHRYRDSLRGLWPFSRHPEHLNKGILFFERYGTKSVVIGRFFGPIRAVIPLVAGMMQMAPRRFLAANIGSALLWAPAYLAPGIVFGASIKLAAEAAGRVAVLLLVLLSLVWLSLWAAKRLFGVLSPHASDWVRRLLRWADLHPSMGRVAYALADPSHPDAITLTGLAAALLGATAVAGITIGAGLIGGGSPLWLNRVALDLGQSLHTPLADALMIRLNALGSWTVLGVLWIGVLLYLLGRGQRREAMYWLAASGFVLVAAPVLGPLLQVSRPSLGLDLFWPWSFPSPPALGATLTYGFAAIMLSRDLPAGGRWIPYALAALLVLAVAVARLYFGAEWLTDIIGSVALGLVWISAIGLAFRRHSARIQPGLGLPLAAGISLLGALTLAGAIDARHGLDRYVPSPALERISVAQWQRRGCDLLPQHRRDLWHRDGRPFQIAYAGDLGALAEALRGLGWRRAERLSWGNALKLLSPSTPLAELPIIPHVHDGHHEELALVKDLSADRRIVLRLWSTQCRIDQDVTIYVGKATLLGKESVVDLIALPLTARNLGEPKRSLHDDLAAAPGLRVDTGAPTLVATAGSGLLP